MAFPQRFLDELRTRVSLVSLIGGSVKLTRHGKEHTGLCPFHNEKSPSFTVAEHKGWFHCFGCGAHGDVIDFVMKTRHMSFPEAVEDLAAHAGLEVPAQSPQERERFKREASLYEAMEFATGFYIAQLAGQAGRAAIDYLTKRGLSPDTIARFRLGFSPDNRTALKTAMTKAGFAEELLVEAGLLSVPEEKGTPYDKFRGRVIFPITDSRGRVIGFGGRAMGDAQPKYLNSPDTPIFHKGHNLYGLSLAREAAHTEKQVLVVEGYMDVISLHQAGRAATVAPLGTAITDEQVNLLWKLSPEPTFVLDGDQAGERAMAKVAEKIFPLTGPGKSAQFVSLPAGEDPDTMILGQGREAFDALTAAPVSLADTIWRMTLDGKKTDTPERAAAAVEAVRTAIASIKNAAVRGQYEKDFQQRLVTTGLIADATIPASRGKEKTQTSDAASLLEPPTAYRDNQIPVQFLSHILGIAPAEILMPTTPVAGWTELAFYDAPPKGSDSKPTLVGNWPCAIFGTEDLQGRHHAQRIYVQPGGKGTALLGMDAQAVARSPYKAAKRPTDESVIECGTVWGIPRKVLQIILCKGIDTGAAIAQGLRDQVLAGQISVIAMPTLASIEAFKPAAMHEWVTICIDQRDSAEEKAARTLARRLGDQVKISVSAVGLGMDIEAAAPAWPAFFRGHGAAALARVVLKPTAIEDLPVQAPDEFPNPYKVVGNGFVWEKVDPKTGEVVPTSLTNFTARIVGDIVRDDGADQHRFFDIEAKLPGQQRRVVRVAADKFAKMDWVASELGHAARTSAGNSLKDHVRAAIQFSSNAGEQWVYAHTGWREIHGKWVYLHRGGGLSADGDTPEIRTDLDLLASGGFELPANDPHSSDDIRATIKLIMGSAKKHVSLPVFSSLWLAPLSHILPPSCVVFFVGFTGTGKTAVASLAQQAFGPRMGSNNLPASWFDTANNLEAKTHMAKDSVTLIDDFVPRGSREDISRANANFARILQQVGNHSGRGRLWADGTLRKEKRPRGLVLSTGEDLANFQSALARALVVDVNLGDVYFGGGLDHAQEAATEGVFARAVVQYVRWLAARLDNEGEKALVREMQARQRTFRKAMTEHIKKATHMRTPENLAYLASGLSMFLRFATEAGAIEEAEASAYWREWWTTLVMLGQEQGNTLTSVDPVRRFFQLLRSALSSGQAHFADRGGDAPTVPAGADYSVSNLGWVAGNRNGDCAGWVDPIKGDVYIEPNAALKAVSRMSSEPFQWTATTLGKRLKERELLAGTDTSRKTLYMKRKLAGAEQIVLWIKMDTLLGANDEIVSISAEPPAMDGNLFLAGGQPIDMPDRTGEGREEVAYRQIIEDSGDQNLLDEFDERISILISDGGLSQQAAERQAAHDVGLIS